MDGTGSESRLVAGSCTAGVENLGSVTAVLSVKRLFFLNICNFQNFNLTLVTMPKVNGMRSICSMQSEFEFIDIFSYQNSSAGWSYRLH